MNELIAVMTITILAVVSPGADFAMITRNSYLYGRIAGLLGSAGISVGVQIHVMYTILGVGILIVHNPQLFMILKYLGAAYLVYVGISTVLSKLPTETEPKAISKNSFSHWQAFRMGFFTNALNPKTMMFVLSVFTQFVSPETPLSVVVGYGIFMSLAHLVWFCMVALFFSLPQLRRALLKRQRAINGVIGLALMCLGISLAALAKT